VWVYFGSVVNHGKASVINKLFKTASKKFKLGLSWRLSEYKSFQECLFIPIQACFLSGKSMVNIRIF
jgi:hypothetical protein